MVNAMRVVAIRHLLTALFVLMGSQVFADPALLPPLKSPQDPSQFIQRENDLRNAINENFMLNDETNSASSFDQYGAVGDGANNDQTGMQAAVLANAGGTVYGTTGKVYTLRGQVYVPSNTTIDCRGATVQFDPTLTGLVNALFWIGYANGDGATNVEVKNCVFKSATTAGYSVFMFQAGSSNVNIHDNFIQDTAGYTLKGVTVRSSRVSNVRVANNTALDLQFLVYIDGGEAQTWNNCVTILTSTTSTSCDNSTHVPAAATGTFAAPAAIQADIAAGMGWGIIAYNRLNGNNTSRLFGPYDYTGTDFTYDSGTGIITFASDLTTAAGTAVQLFTWNPETRPANDLQYLTVTNNIARRIRSTAVQINCAVRQNHRMIPSQDCVRNVTITNNQFDGDYQLEGMSGSFVVGAGHSNKILWSQDLTNAVWTQQNITSASGSTVKFYSPPYDYTPTAQKLTESTANGVHTVKQGLAGITAGTPWTFSCFLRADTRTKARLYFPTNVGNGVAADVDLVAGTVAASNIGTGTGAAAGLRYAGSGGPGSLGASGWYRVWVSGTLDATSVQPGVIIRNAAGNTSYTGDGTSGIYAWGCQLNDGVTPLQKYIPTKGVSAGTIVTQMISVNGVSNFVVANNVLGPMADGGIHLEDFATHGVVTGNVLREVGSVGIWASDTENVAITNNTIYDAGQGCVNLNFTNPAYPSTSFGAYNQDVDITLTGNKCDLYSNPNASYTYWIGSASGPFRLNIQDNSAYNLPTGVLPYLFTGGENNFQSPPVPNLLVNPSFDLDQPNEGANYSVTTGAPVMDGWRVGFTSAATGVTIARASASPPTGGGNYAFLTIGTGSATVNAGDFIDVLQRLRGMDIASSKFGTASARPMSLSWKQKCSVAGDYSVSIQNNAQSRSFVHPFTLAADAWTQEYLTIPGDTGGSWTLSGTAAAMRVVFAFEAGASQVTTATDRWNANGIFAASTQTQLSQTTGGTCSITDVNLQVSPEPTNMLRRPFAQDLNMAQQFFTKTFPLGTAVGNNKGLAGAMCAPGVNATAGTLSTNFRFPVAMNASPTIATYNPSNTNSNWRDVTGGSDVVVLQDPSTAKGTTGFQIGSQTTALTVGDNYCIHASGDARL